MSPEPFPEQHEQPAAWEVVWRDPGERMLVERQHGRDGHVRHRFRSNEPGDGAVVLVEDAGRVLFIEIARPVTGRVLWELPRGQAEPEDDGPLATAARELLEETGLRCAHLEHLGAVWPDSGLSGDSVHVVRARGPLPLQDVDVARAELTAVRWLRPAEIADAVRSGRLRDAISMAALALAAVASGREPDEGVRDRPGSA